MTTYSINGVPCPMQPCILRHAHDHQLNPAINYETHAVLAGAYKGRQLSERTLHTHTVRVDDGWFAAVLCGGVDLDSIADSEADDPNAPPSCPRCAKRDPRFTPRR